MKIDCACLNNAPVRIQDNSTKDERYECYYCKFKWRYVSVYSSICYVCNESGVNAFNKIQKDYKTCVKCYFCGNYHSESKYAPQQILVLW
jgi:hypothetical protein